MIWINGQVADKIDASDRSFNYGDGGFTTIKTCDGKLEHWPLHITRMQDCLALLRIAQPDWKQVQGWLEHAATDRGEGGVKLLISRGSGGRGYSPKGVDVPTVVISSFNYPAHYCLWQNQGVELGVVEPRLGLNPLLAGHKHNNRLEQVMMKADMDQQGFADGVVLDINGHIVETTMANLFWVSDNILYTPSLEQAGVAGIGRRLAIKYAQEMGIDVVIGQFDLKRVFEAQEVFISNALLGIAPVIKIATNSFCIGIITRNLQERIHSV
ncbi:aminodeoxychorismate lyase [Vibrio gallicus]|uniref:aminodeoxychorismate lyase n=1 Tax=Vibrio gallicus TaxID=190897 RepID=UPI0021C2E84A|nr:aminodeoxychorismate lyase [Vibrio gallicus]